MVFDLTPQQRATILYEWLSRGKSWGFWALYRIVPDATTRIRDANETLDDIEACAVNRVRDA